MEEANTEAVNTIVATFVDKAVTGAIEDAFTLAVDKAVKEKEKALEERLKAMEDLFETVQEKVNLAQEKAEEEFRRVEEHFRIVKEEVKALTADVDQAVNEQMIAREAAMQEQCDRRFKAAVLKAKIEAVCSASPESIEILTRKVLDRKDSL
jgi:hypothetical protein